MRLGLVHINMGPMSRPDALVQAARAAEQAGFDSVWAGEHLVVPDPQVPPSPMAPQDPVLDSLLALTWAAAHTATIRLATGIVILPQRNPVLLAKQVATLDVLSGGRVMLGVGAGYLEPEFRAAGRTSPNAARSPTSTSTRCGRCGTTSIRSSAAGSRVSAVSTLIRDRCSDRSR
jgi:alkanesulfonate monooxygenase SsuD/methylene tetrahydromethanopterin reductase-like flavin-dependent oxidoreductase (luciferase family)